MSTYFDLVESFEVETARIRSLGPEHFERVTTELVGRGSATLAPLGVESFEKLMIWHTDKLYRLLNRVEMLDRASFVFLSAIGAVFDAAAQERRRAMAYLVDNVVPFDRLMGLQAAFNALRFVVASPELMAIALAKHDGLEGQDVLSNHFERYRAEASALALRLVVQAVEQRRHFIWLSGETSTDVLRDVASRLGDAYVGVFRNDAPVDGTNVQVFQAMGVRDPLD